MRFQLITLVLLVSLLLTFAAASMIIDSKVSSPQNHRIATNHNVETTKRLIETDITAKIYNEERGVPALSNLKSKIAEPIKLRHWLHKNTNVDDVFAKLKLDGGVDEAIFSPKLKTMNNYVDMFNKKNPNQQTSLLTMLTSRYDEADIAIALASERHTKRSMRMVNDMLQTQQFEGWLNNQKSVDDVISLLKFKEDGALAMARPKLTTLVEYTRLFNERNPALETSLFHTLRNAFGENTFRDVVATAMRTDRTYYVSYVYGDMILQQWRRGDYKPVDDLVQIFNMEKANLAVDTVKEPIETAYRSLLKRTIYFDKHDPDKLTISLVEFEKWVEAVQKKTHKPSTT